MDKKIPIDCTKSLDENVIGETEFWQVQQKDSLEHLNAT